MAAISSSSIGRSMSSYSPFLGFPKSNHNNNHMINYGIKTRYSSLVINCSSESMPFSLKENGTTRGGPFKWQRVSLKVSGEALAGDHEQNSDPKVTMAIAREVADVTRLGIQVAIVVGGGNIFRGASWAGNCGLDRSSADYIGMLATVMNVIYLQATMESIGIPTRVQTGMSEVAEPYIRRRAVRHLEKGRAVIFAAGTGNPFFTTDTTAALRCAESRWAVRSCYSGLTKSRSCVSWENTTTTNYGEALYAVISFMYLGWFIKVNYLSCFTYVPKK